MKTVSKTSNTIVNVINSSSASRVCEFTDNNLSYRKRKFGESIGNMFDDLDKAFERSDDEEDSNNSNDNYSYDSDETNNDNDVNDKSADVCMRTNITGSMKRDKQYKDVTKKLSHAPTAEDVIAIEKMLENGFGVVDHPNSKVELKPSRLGEVAGRGLFVRDGCTIKYGDCITEYTGDRINEIDVETYSTDAQLYNLAVDNTCINGHTEPVRNEGFALHFLSTTMLSQLFFTHHSTKFLVFLFHKLDPILLPFKVVQTTTFQCCIHMDLIGIRTPM